ncbi:MAG: helix-turn-helix domain-containing protein [Gemmatimonadaceae bacterium]
MRIVSPGGHLTPRSAASSAILKRASSRLLGAQKNALRSVWPVTVRVVRSPYASRARSLVRPAADLSRHRRVACRRCRSVKQERLDFLADTPFYTKRFAFWVGRRCRAATIQDVAREAHLNWKTVKSARDAVHARAAAAHGHARSAHHRTRRDLDSQRSYVSHRRE